MSRESVDPTPTPSVSARPHNHTTYLAVHSRAVASWRARSARYSCAISGTSGSSGLGSVRREQMERRTWGGVVGSVVRLVVSVFFSF